MMMLKGKFQGERDRDKDYVTNSDHDKGLQVSLGSGKDHRTVTMARAVKRKHWQ